MTGTLRRHLALGLLSAALIALQLVLMQTFSISQWHHFAYMVISIALLGFGAAGTLLALGRAWILPRSADLVPLLLLACALSLAFAAGRAQLLFSRFDSYLLPYDPAQTPLFLALSLLLCLPFLLGALVIGILFSEQAEQIGITYFSNLIGSGVGGLLGIVALAHFAPEKLAPMLAFGVLFAGLLLLQKEQKKLWLAAAVTAGALALALTSPPELPLSQFKDLQKTLDLPNSRTLAIRDDPYGQVRAVTSPALRFAPGLSLGYRGPIPTGDALFSNGDWFGFVPAGAFTDTARLLDQTTQGLPYAIRQPETVLVLHAGTGLSAAQALNHQAANVTAVEPHRAALELLQRVYPETAGRFFSQPQLRLVATNPRTWLATDSESYDLILLPTLGAFGGTAGVFALHEQYSLTREAFAEIWRHLSPDGMLALTVWMDYPPRAPLRLAATLVELLEKAGIASSAPHLAAVRSWGTITFCLKRSPLTATQLGQIRRFCSERGLDPLLLPDLTPEEREHFNALQDRSFFTLIDQILSDNRQALYANYLFNLRPTTDDRPFFSQFLRWETLPHLETLLGGRTLPALELGTLVVLITFFLMSSEALLLILLPLLRLGWSGGQRLPTIGYFGSLGLGYMLVEMALIHRFVLFLGDPVSATATVICALLLGSGFGSACSARMPHFLATPQRASATLACMLLPYLLLLAPLLRQSGMLTESWRIAVTLLLLIPIGFVMGLPFPLGLRRLNGTDPEAVPWAWGINGCLSVLATSLATLIAVQAGFNAVMILAAAVYGGAALAAGRIFSALPPKNCESRSKAPVSSSL